MVHVNQFIHWQIAELFQTYQPHANSSKVKRVKSTKNTQSLEISYNRAIGETTCTKSVCRSFEVSYQTRISGVSLDFETGAWKIRIF